MLTPLQNSQYGTPVFIITNKEVTVMFITYYRRINHKLVRNPYPLPRIDKTMQQLEVFQYATALYINMGYYTIRLSTASQDTMTIVTEFSKFRCNHLPIFMCVSGETFQAKVDELLGNIKGIKMYIDNIT